MDEYYMDKRTSASMMTSEELEERRNRPCTGTVDMPTFLLKASDLSADVVVDLWVLVNRRMREHLATGYTPEEARDWVRQYYFLDSINAPTLTQIPKLDSALAIAEQMRQYTGPKKVAD